MREDGSGTLASIQLSLASEGYSIGDLKLAAELGSAEAVCQRIKNKVGVSILSALAVSEDLKIGSLKAVTVKGLKLKRSFYFTRHKYRSLSPISRVFAAFLKKELVN